MLTYENCPQIYGFAKHLVTVVFSRQPRQQEEIMNLMGTFFCFVLEQRLSSMPHNFRYTHDTCCWFWSLHGVC